jgi:hypothetical protein
MVNGGAMRYLKPIIGITLIILALVGGYYWETQGRENYQQIEIPVTTKDIERGEKLNPQMMETIFLDEKSIVKGALGENDISKILDYRATQFIPANSQIVASYFVENETSLTDKKSVFSIPSSWIFSRSSTLRKGDWVEVFGEEELMFFGKYEIAFVKDQSEVEVENLEGPFIQKNILERTAGTGIIHHIEICCTLEEYSILYEYIRETVMGLILVQREELQ